MQDILNFLQTHWQLTATLIAVLALLFIVELIKLKRGANRINPVAATDLINHKNAVIVDTRGAEAFASGHIIGSVSLPVAELLSKNKKIEKLKSQPIVLVCNADHEAQKIATSLQQQGFAIYILGGGIRAWREADLPLVK